MGGPEEDEEVKAVFSGFAHSQEVDPRTLSRLSDVRDAFALMGKLHTREKSLRRCTIRSTPWGWMLQESKKNTEAMKKP